MNKFMVIIALLMITFNAQAGTVEKYTCANVGGTEEWTVYVDLQKKLAGFFDNDSTVTIPLVRVLPLETYPPQTEYIFEGQDQDSTIMRITFNKTKLGAKVTFNVGGKNQETLDSLDGCEVAPDLDIE